MTLSYERLAILSPNGISISISTVYLKGNTLPDWEIVKLVRINRLPAVQWKLKNLERMDPKKHAAAVERMKRCLDL